jgi:hypothetical protein
MAANLKVLDDLAGVGGAAAKSGGELLTLAKAAAKTQDEFNALASAIKAAGKADDDMIAAAKLDFKPSGAILNKLPVVVDDAAGAARGADEAAGAARGADEAAGAARGADEAADAAKANAAGIKNTDDYLKKAKKLCAETRTKWCVGAVLGSAAAIYAADKYMKIKNYKGKITKIEPGEDGGLPIIGGGTKVAKVTYSEAVDILPTDTITISGTNCSPPIDGDHTPYKIASKTEFWIKFDVGLTSPGSKGDFTITTGVVERLGEAVGKGAGAAGAAAGTAAGAAAGAAASGLGQGGSAFLKSLTSGAGMWLTLILCCLCFAFIIFKFIL